VARTDAAHRNLAGQFAARQVEKTYVALVHGSVKNDQGRINTPIARDPGVRVRMTARLTQGRSAITSYQVLKRFEQFTLLEVKIGTGRTHQIRVHLASVRHPVVGDKLYGAPASALGRYFLHARQITFSSPGTGERITVSAPLPGDLEDHLSSLA
jgi:23S rRNA pseudouridine1911/1915/1917 synthase